MKKLAIYDPYLPILGGAERYAFSLGLCFPEYEITFFADDPNLINKAEVKFGIDLPQIKVKPWPKERNERNEVLSTFDLFFYITDGSIFYAKARKNILIIQSPLHIPSKNLVNAVKLFSWQKIICYSDFVSGTIKEKLGKRADVLFVPIAEEAPSPKEKERIILSVGRFFPHLHSKKQKEMVEVFKELVKEGLKDTVLYLVGSIDPGADDYFEVVEKAADGYPIKLLTKASYDELVALYKKAKIYWHAAGWKEDIKTHPERAEHFGVSTVEAMSHGAVPVVFDGGGQKEIVSHNQNGFLWDSKDDLKKYTHQLLTDSSLHHKLSASARLAATSFSQDKFCRKLHEILEK